MRTALADALVGFSAAQKLLPHPREVIAKRYGKSVADQIMDAPNYATAEHIYRGALGGAKDASPETRRKWARALAAKWAEEANERPVFQETEPLVDVDAGPDAQEPL